MSSSVADSEFVSTRLHQENKISTKTASIADARPEQWGNRAKGLQELVVLVQNQGKILSHVAAADARPGGDQVGRKVQERFFVRQGDDSDAEQDSLQDEEA